MQKTLLEIPIHLDQRLLVSASEEGWNTAKQEHRKVEQ